MESSPIEEARWHQLLRQLNLRTLYRCMLLFKVCNKVLNRNLVWPHLVARDLAPVPEFTVNLKLYYLRAMNFSVPSTEYLLRDLVFMIDQECRRSSSIDRSLVSINREDVLMRGELFVLSRGNTLTSITDPLLNDEYTSRLPTTTTIKRVVRNEVGLFSDNKYLLSTDGELFDLRGERCHFACSLPNGEVIADVECPYRCNYAWILAKSGRVYWATVDDPQLEGYISDMYICQSPMILPRPAVSFVRIAHIDALVEYGVVGVILTTGEVYRLSDAERGFTPLSVGPLPPRFEYREIGDQCAYTLTSDGRLHQEQHIENMELVGELRRYHFLDIAYSLGGHLLRGFKR